LRIARALAQNLGSRGVNPAMRGIALAYKLARELQSLKGQLEQGVRDATS